MTHYSSLLVTIESTKWRSKMKKNGNTKSNYLRLLLELEFTSAQCWIVCFFLYRTTNISSWAQAKHCGAETILTKIDWNETRIVPERRSSVSIASLSKFLLPTSKAAAFKVSKCLKITNEIGKYFSLSGVFLFWEHIFFCFRSILLFHWMCSNLKWF